METMYLVLENGRYFQGKAFGAPLEETTGEVVFTTGMNGYLETITDPSYCGQIVVQTFPMIGNYGVIPDDFESQKPYLAGYIVREWCREPSNYRCEGDLDTFFKAQGIPALEGIDTRALTRCLRESGTMNGRLTRKAPPYSEEELQEIREHRVSCPVRTVSSTSTMTYRPATEPEFKVALWDFGAKGNILQELLDRGCEVTVFPQDSTAEEIAAYSPDGIMLSNGPGDPEENPEIIRELAKLCEKKIPTFGICLGHQLLALSQGAKTSKLKYGHRGANQPVEDLTTGRIYVTSQNHGYMVDTDTLPAGAKLRFVNANDGTCEGVSYDTMPAFSVQFHPEACPGPWDARWLFGEFTEMMRREK